MKTSFACVVFVSAMVACSNNNPGNDAGTTPKDAASDTKPVADSGPANDAAPEAGNDAAAPVNGCTSFTDMTANGGTITGPSTLSPSQYSPNCVHVKVGQSVTWNADFTDHPMAASGGDTPSPITTTSSGTTVTFAFPNAGTFGYHCMVHPTIMFGAVEVTP